MNWYKL